MEKQSTLNRARRNGASISARNGRRAVRPAEARRTEQRYRQRRLHDVEEAAKLGMSDEFLQSVGVPYIAGESNLRRN